jgi:hypothetical protein
MAAGARPWQVLIEELLRDLRSGAGGLSGAEVVKGAGRRRGRRLRQASSSSATTGA